MAAVLGLAARPAPGRPTRSNKSVTQTSGIAAGDGGYDISVGHHTDLTGGVIASTADPSKNLFSTGSLSYTDLQNEADYSAWSASVSGGYGTGNAGGMTGFHPGGSVPQGKSSSSVTHAGIAQGTIDVRDNPGQNLSGLDRNPDINSQGLKTIFDAQKVAENQEAGQVAGYVGMRTVGAIAEHEYNKAVNDKYNAAEGSAEEADAEARMKAWGDGGEYKTILHGMVGAGTAALGGGNALQGAVGATASEAASGQMQQYLHDHDIDPNSAQGRSLMNLASLGVGAAAGGGSGAVTALNGEQYNRQLHPAELSLIVGELAKEYASDYNAAHPDDSISERDAEKLLMEQALRQVDNQWATELGPDDGEARAWLATHAANYALPNGEQVFTATQAEKNNWNLYSELYRGEYTEHHAAELGLGANYGLRTDLSGSEFGEQEYLQVADDMRDRATLDALYRKVGRGESLTESEIHEVSWLQMLKPVLELSTPPAAIGISIADGKYKQAVGQSLLLLAPAAAEGGGLLSAGKAAGSVYETPLWQSLGSNDSLTLENLQALYGSANVTQGGGNVLQMIERVTGNVVDSQSARAASNFDQYLEAVGVPDTGVDTAAVRSRVLGNIADSQAARASSNFGQFSQAEGQLQEVLGIWPPNGGGYAPIYDTTLDVGTQLDRYGYPGGRYLSPLGDSFGERALPPSYLSTKPYFQYEVIQPIPGVTKAKALPWFGQPGMGTQFEVPNSVQWYLNKGYLKVIHP